MSPSPVPVVKTIMIVPIWLSLPIIIAVLGLTINIFQKSEKFDPCQGLEGKWLQQKQAKTEKGGKEKQSNDPSKIYGGAGGEDPNRDPQKNKKLKSDCEANLKKTKLDPRELVNINTTRVIGGSYATVTADTDGNEGLYEAHHFIPFVSFKNSKYNIDRNQQPAIRILKKDHNTLYNSKNSKKARNFRAFDTDILNTEGIANATRYEITFFNDVGLLPQYAVGIVQMVEQMFDDKLIDIVDLLKILNQLWTELESIKDSKKPEGVNNLADFIKELIEWIKENILMIGCSISD